MRILQGIEFFSPKMGGSAQVAFQVSRHLAQRGHEVSVWASDYGSREARFPEEGFQTHLFPTVFARWGFYFTPSLISWARDHLQEFDIIHLHNVRTFQNLVVGYYARRFGIPYVLQAHGSLPYLVERKIAKRVFDILFGRRMVAGAGKLLAVSPVEVDQYQQFGVPKEKIALVYNGLDLDEFADLPAPGAFRAHHNIPDSIKIILSLGRLHKRKHNDHLIAAYARLRESLPDSLLVIAGPDDGDLTRLETMVGQMDVEDQVLFPGALYKEDKLATLVDADVTVLPAEYEIFGLVPFESILCGTPVVVTQESGSGQLIEDQGAGYLVPFGDVNAISDALKSALSPHEEAQTMLISGQEYLRRCLDWNTITRDIEQIYSFQLKFFKASVPTGMN